MRDDGVGGGGEVSSIHFFFQLSNTISYNSHCILTSVDQMLIRLNSSL
jgi:hypothetical protein